MNKNFSSTIYISLLPIVVLVLIIFGVGYYLTDGEFDFGDKKDNLNARSIDGFPTTVVTSADIAKQRLVLKSQEELNDYISMIDSSGQLKVEEKVNFEKEYVLAVSTELLNTSGYEFEVDKIEVNHEERKVNITARESKPGETCEVETFDNIALDLVVIDRTDYEIEFDRTQRTVECN